MAQTIINYIISKLSDVKFKDKHKNRKTDFQRKRKDAPLGFCQTQQPYPLLCYLNSRQKM